jgi:hypothetical protein
LEFHWINGNDSRQYGLDFGVWIRKVDAPELTPDELVWSPVKRTGGARAPRREGGRLIDKICAQLA